MKLRSVFGGTSLLLLAFPAGTPAQTPQDFFRDDTVKEIRLAVAPADWRTLQERYLEDTYYPADFEWNGIAIPRIGIKSRGSGSRSPIKPSLNLDFSRYSSSQRFLTMKSFILRNLSQDASMMHERLTLLLFARAGLPSLRSVHTRLYINGEYFGLFLAVEPIEKRFLATRVGEDTGYLYQMQWTGTGYAFEYLGGDPDLYVPRLFEPKTREDAPDAGYLVEMIRTMNQAPDSEFAAAVGKYIDLPAFVSHVAAEQFLAEADGVLGESGMTNFYFYRRSADDRSLFFVWDKDGTFNNSYWSIWNNTERNVLMRRSLGVPELRRRFLDTVFAPPKRRKVRVDGSPPKSSECTHRSASRRWKILTVFAWWPRRSRGVRPGRSKNGWRDYAFSRENGETKCGSNSSRRATRFRARLWPWRRGM